MRGFRFMAKQKKNNHSDIQPVPREAIAELMVPPEEDRKKIGFELKEEKGKYRKKTKADNA
jgi:hypothetical protein